MAGSRGHGVIRIFASNQIHVAFHTPPLSALYPSQEEALLGIARILTPEEILVG